MNVCRAVHVLALAVFREIVPFVPPSRAPSVPVSESDEPILSDDVATVFSVPLDPAVYATPLDVRFDRFVMF